ncbi:MAG: LamG-like jellyroll fold domain-containing protein, partial [Bacteroidota bacterium]
NTIMSRAYCNAGRYAYHFYVTDGKLAWQTYDDGDCTNPTARITTKSVVITEGVWHHVAVTHDGTNENVILYVDGVAYNQGQPTETELLGGVGHPIGAVTEPIRVGLLRPSGSIPAGSFHGNMDDVLLFHEVRSSTDIVADMVSTAVPVHSGTLKLRLTMNAPAMGRDDLIPNLISATNNGLTKDYASNALSRPDQTPFTIYNDTEICCSSASNPNRIAPPTAVISPVAPEKLVLSPNPNTGRFAVEWPTASGQKGQVEVRSMVTGQLVFSGKLTSGAYIDLKTDPSGAYVVTVLTENGELLSAKTISGLK